MSIETIVITTIGFILIHAFFAGSETALVSCDKRRLKALAEGGSKIARLALDSYEVERFIRTTLVGMKLCLVVSTIIMAFYIEDTYGSEKELYTISIVSFSIIILGNVVPRVFFKKYGDKMALLTIYPLFIASKLFSPILFLMNVLTKEILKFNGSGENALTTREECFHEIEDESRPLSTGDQTRKRESEYREKIIRRIFRFSETTLEEIMIPLTQVSAMSEDAPVKEAIKLIKETGHSRIPLYYERIDNVTRMLHAFYLLGANPDEPVKNFSQTPFYIPESKPLDELLDEMKKGRAGMAVVVDEYGGAVGVITLENILEEIVGEIEDEYDKGTKLWRKTSDDEYLVNARIYIEGLNEETGLEIPEGEYDTLSGFLLSEEGAIPRAGDKIRYRNYIFTVTKASPRSIEEVKLTIEK